MKALALLPAHGEAANLAQVVGELRRLQPGLEVLVVDDASDDETGELLPSLGVRWLRLCTHLGVGGAVRAGLRYARQRGFDTVVRLDADGQHPVEAVPRLLEALAPGGADVALGSRHLAPGSYRSPLGRRAAQRVLALGLSALTRRSVTDPTSGFWAFGPRAVRLLSHHHPTGYAEPELTLLLAANGLSVREVPVQMRERQAGASSLTLPRALGALARAALAMLVVPMRTPEVLDD